MPSILPYKKIDHQNYSSNGLARAIIRPSRKKILPYETLKIQYILKLNAYI